MSLNNPVDVASLVAQLQTDPAAVALRIKQLATSGDLDATVVLAQMHAEGKGVEADADQAFHLFHFAAQHGHAEGMNMLGRCHDLGHGTARNVEMAVVWYRRAAESGSDWGRYNFANALATGKGIAQDQARAYREYRKAAEAGHAKSMNLVGRFLEEGIAVAENPTEALDWYARSARAGDFRGQASFASILAECGRLDEAEFWLRKAIAAGSPSFLETMQAELSRSAHPRLRALGDALFGNLRKSGGDS